VDKVKKQKKFKSIKRTFIWYLPICVLTAYLGAYCIGFAFNELQNWFEDTYSEENYQTIPEGTPGVIINDGNDKETENYLRIEFSKTINGITYYDVRGVGEFVSDNPWHRFLYGVISFGQGALMVSWVLLCVFVTGILFYKRELETPIDVLMEASDKISENCLDFELKPVKNNELGRLCQSFEDMRMALYENNRELWHTLEERKRLNAAFSHDIRTPLSVLKGYQEMMHNYVPEDKFSREQLMEMIETMGGQIERLENYTRKMSAVQKLEDIVPERSVAELRELSECCRESGRLLADGLSFELRTEQEKAPASEILIDKELFMEVFENLVSNAVRFAKNGVSVTLQKKDGTLLLAVEDDGPGFSAEALQKATEPFYGSEKDGKMHFGLGLYICKSICEKHGGRLHLENHSFEDAVCGGRVTAVFGVEGTEEKT